MKTLKYFSCIILLLFQPISAQDFWHKITGSLGDVNVTDLCLTQSGILLAYIHWDGLYYTTNNGDQWINTNYHIYEPPNPLETINDSIFIVGGYEHTYVSTDTGKTWTTTGNFDVKSIYYESISQLLYVGTNKGYPNVCGIYRSNDFGQSWELIHTFPSLTEGQWVNALLVTKTSHVILANVVYSGQYGGFYRFYKSTDYGQTWEVIFEALWNGITRIIEDVSTNLFAIGNQKLYISEDEGKTWISRNIPESDVLAADYSGRIYRGLSYSIR
jgi:hypothetical protein